MKKHTLLLLLFSISHLSSFSQKHDFNWLLGYSTRDNPFDTAWGITKIDFDTPDGNPLMTYNGNKKIDFHIACTSISDVNGRYLFSCNGAYIEDSLDQLLKNSDLLARNYSYPDDGESTPQGVLILPYPEFYDKFILFHKEDIFLNDYGIVSNLLYSVVEFNKQYPRGIMTQKRISLVKDSLDSACLTAVKHANGRDWWVLVSEDNQISYYVFLLSNTGVQFVSKQTFPGRKVGGGVGQTFFSNDGKYLATATSDDYLKTRFNNIYFFTFDRCSGILDNLTYIKYPYHDETWATGCSFSPDNKLFYVVTADSLYQYSIVDNKLTGKESIAGYDGYTELVIPPDVYWSTWFGMLQQAPDGRIYGSGFASSCRSIDVINKPNFKGKNCDFRPHSVTTITMKTALPSYHNYRLGPIDGSFCDTLGIDNIPWCHWRYDQDTSDYLNFEFTDLSAYEVTQWSWDFGDPKSDSNESMKKNPNHRFSGNGVYDVTLIVKNSNGSDTLLRTIKIGNVVSTKDESIILDIQMWPNPCKNYFVVNVLDYNPEKMILHLFNNLGKELLTQRLYQGSNIFDAGFLSSGEYHILIHENGKELRTEKLVKL